VIEFEEGGEHYRTMPIPAKIQFHISRRIAPLVPPLVPAFNAIVKAQGLSGGAAAHIEALSQMLQPFTDALSNMSDEHFDYI
jgi:hypothetical protein